MSKQFNVAVVGATGAVGEVMLSILAERKFPIGKIHALASERSAYLNGAELLVDGGLGCMLMDMVPRPGFNQTR